MLETYTEFRKGIFFLRLQGEMTAETTYLLKKEISLLLRGVKPGYIVLNLKNVTRIDRKGLEVLNHVFTSVEEAGGSCMFCPSESVNVRDYVSENALKKRVRFIDNELSAFTLVKI
ncbi:MAG: STAS domain-containing protein [Bacilli bacterium]|nr:STAS domain-containing protein [Bacilli bacterium]